MILFPILKTFLCSKFGQISGSTLHFEGSATQLPNSLVAPEISYQNLVKLFKVFNVVLFHRFNVGFRRLLFIVNVNKLSKRRRFILFKRGTFCNQIPSNFYLILNILSIHFTDLF